MELKCRFHLENLAYTGSYTYEDDIKDKGKQDYFAKVLAILQICWLIFSLITRKIRGLPFSQFETLTLGLAVCGIVVYITYWYKPQGVGMPIKVAKREGSKMPHFDRTYDNFWDVLSNSRGKKGSEPVDRIKDDNIPLAKSDKWHATIIMLAVLSAIFGCIHIIAWSFEFPSDVEKLLWRIATIMSIVVPGLCLITILLAQFTAQDGDPREFMRNCLDVLREFSWFYHDTVATSEAMIALESIYNNPSLEGDDARRLYKDIFSTGTESSLSPEMLKFIQKEKGTTLRKAIQSSCRRNFHLDSACWSNWWTKKVQKVRSIAQRLMCFPVEPGFQDGRTWPFCMPPTWSTLCPDLWSWHWLSRAFDLCQKGCISRHGQRIFQLYNSSSYMVCVVGWMPKWINGCTFRWL